jgi:ribosomal-protein-alanine N-acetyltransferase
VSPAHRRKGIGARLLSEMERLFREKGVKVCRLEVREDNLRALELYRKFGYDEIGKLRNYYGSAHGIYLRKALP